MAIDEQVVMTMNEVTGAQPLSDTLFSYENRLPILILSIMPVNAV